VGPNAKVVVRSHRSPSLGPSAFTMSMRGRSFYGPLDTPFGDSPIEDDVDVRVVLKAFEQMPVQPLVIARNHELVSHCGAILRPFAHYACSNMHVQNLSSVEMKTG
jgi:hypothetical protein